MKKISTVCARDCYDSCSLVVNLGELERIDSIKGDRLNPITQGFTCPRGAKDHKRLVKNRVESPALYQKNKFEKVNWDKALSIVSRKLKKTIDQYGAEAVLNLCYAGNIGLLTTGIPQRLWNAIGATKTDGGLCSKSGHAGLALHYGETYGIKPLELLSADLIVLWGFNAAVSSPHMWSLAQKARKQRNAKIVVIDPMKNRTAKSAYLWINPKPGSDVALAYGMINYLIQNDLIDLRFIKKWTLGFEKLKAKARQWTLDRVENITGIARNQLEKIGILYGQNKKNATMIGIGLQKCDQGADQVRIVSMIPALLGIHRGFFYGNSNLFYINESLISGKTLTEKTPEIVEQVALADLIETGRFKFIYINCMNPALTIPNLKAFRKGLSRSDVFVVVHETHWTRTTQYADVVLPAPTFLEKDDLVVPWGHNYVRYSHKAIPPITNSKNEVWVMQEIAKRLGLNEKWLYEDPWMAVEKSFENALAEGSFQTLKKGNMLTLKTKPMNAYATPSGKIEFHSSSATAIGLDPLPEQKSLIQDKKLFIMINSSKPQYTHTQFQEVYGKIPAMVIMNPKDAEKLDLIDGQPVTLVNKQGQVQAKIKIKDIVPEQVVWSPRLFEGLDGKPMNDLMTGRPQKIGQGPRFNSTKIRINKTS